MDLQLGGQKVLITGGSRGIGRAIASSMAKEGCQLHLASRTEADLQQAQVEITETTGSEVSIHAFDNIHLDPQCRSPGSGIQRVQGA